MILQQVHPIDKFHIIRPKIAIKFLEIDPNGVYYNANK